ncbi:Protein FAM132B, partial [Pterocles gutturalis]
PQSERMFYRGLELNLTTGQYTAPVAGYYTFMATLHIVRRKQRRNGQPCGGTGCVQARCRYSKAKPRGEGGPEPSREGGLQEGVPALCPLSLQAGQFASVSVDNTADPPLTVQKVALFPA